MTIYPCILKLKKKCNCVLQMALAPYKNLPQEIESLKLVIEIRNEEIQKLRNRNIDLEKQVCSTNSGFSRTVLYERTIFG